MHTGGESGQRRPFTRTSASWGGVNFLQQTVREVAAREEVGPLDLDTPLEAAVDTDLLGAFVEASGDRGDGSRPVMEFEYYGYAVRVAADGDVTVADDSDDDDQSAGARAQAKAALSAQSERRADALQRATDVVAARERPFEDRLDGVLEVVRKHLDVSAATLSYVDRGAYTFEAVDATERIDLQAGTVIPLEATTCKRVVETEQALVTRNLAADAPELTDSTFDVRSYLGMPVFVDGDCYGTFCFFDDETREEAFADWDRSLVELLSEWVGSELEQRHRDRALHASTSERPYSRC